MASAPPTPAAPRILQRRALHDLTEYMFLTLAEEIQKNTHDEKITNLLEHTIEIKIRGGKLDGKCF